MHRPIWANTGEIRRFNVEKRYLNFWSSGKKYINCMPGSAHKRAITGILRPLCTWKYTLITCEMWSYNFDWGAFGYFIYALVHRGWKFVRKIFQTATATQDRNFKRLKKVDPVQNIKIMLSVDGSTYMGKFGRVTAVQNWPNVCRALRITNLPRSFWVMQFQNNSILHSKVE